MGGGLDALVPQKVEQLADFFNGLDSQVPVQVIYVPKVSQDSIPQRTVDLAPQMAEQLVEVPTPFFIFEQNVDNPAPRVGGSGSGGLHGFLSGQGSTAFLKIFREDLLEIFKFCAGTEFNWFWP